MCIEYSNGTPNFMPFHLLGSRLSLYLFARTIAWPLVFCMAGTVKGCAVEPVPMVIASGIGASRCEASYSPERHLSRATAQPAVLITSTSRPFFL